MRQYKTPNFVTGDKVAYSVQFLRNIGMSHSDMARGRGEITDITTHGDSFTLATIKWGKNADLPEHVLVHNLAKVGPNPRFCNVD